jgi:hypothetical protein
MRLLNILLKKRKFTESELERAIEESRHRHDLIAGPADDTKYNAYVNFLNDYMDEHPKEPYENAILACKDKYPSWWNSRN